MADGVTIELKLGSSVFRHALTANGSEFSAGMVVLVFRYRHALSFLDL